MSPTPARARATGSLNERQVERRSHSRYPVTLEIEYKLLTADSGEQIGIGKTINISRFGVLFEATDALPARREVEVLVHWPVSKELTGPLKLIMRGRVIRSAGKLVAVRVSRHEFRIGATLLRDSLA
jgi:hypothetical protein